MVSFCGVIPPEKSGGSVEAIRLDLEVGLTSVIPPEKSGGSVEAESPGQTLPSQSGHSA